MVHLHHIDNQHTRYWSSRLRQSKRGMRDRYRKGDKCRFAQGNQEDNMDE